MTDLCTIRAFDGCSCPTGNCRSAAIPLGRFTKSRDMRGVFTTKQSDYLAIFATLLVVLAVGFTVIKLREEARQHELQARI